MRFTLQKRKDGTVEIRLFDGEGDSEKETIWICENDQAAIFKLAHLLFSMGETPEQAKRSVLVGEFVKKSSRPAEPERPDLEAIKKAIEKAMEESGKVPYGPGLIPSVPNWPLGGQPFITPLPYTSPTAVPYIIPGTTWIGDPLPGTPEIWVTNTGSATSASFVIPKNLGEIQGLVSDAVYGASAGSTANTFFTSIKATWNGGSSGAVASA